MVTQSNDVDKILRNWHAAYVGHDIVYMPPAWKTLFPSPYTFVYVNSELNATDYANFYRCSSKNKLSNTRLFTPRTLQYASILHPAFYKAVKKTRAEGDKKLNQYLRQLTSLKMHEEIGFGLDLMPTRFWLQSVLFLAGVTLSAAIIQNRWSIGTLESKLSRLWQLAQYQDMEELNAVKGLNIEAFVIMCAKQLSYNPVSVLKELKLFYSKVLKLLVDDIPVNRKEIRQSNLTALQKKRFGFVNDLKSKLGKNMQCMMVYGSATNSAHFADYDLIIIVKKVTEALDHLAGTSPVYNGLELNISVFDEQDFETYQLISGDNLADHAICLYGACTVPHKPSTYLVARNYSFGFVRFRQLLGMADHFGNGTAAPDEKLNLLNYFIKIPINVFKGIQGCYGSIDTNEQIRSWAKNKIGFDVNNQQLLAREGFSMDSIANAAWATQEIMHWFDKKQFIFKAMIPEKATQKQLII